MESGILGQSPLNHLEFERDLNRRDLDLRRIPLPDELPPAPSLRNIPQEILRSSTVENLISQNEDLMARLKVSLRRLSALEMENQRVSQEAEQLRQKSTITEDQILILKEKDQAWKLKQEGLNQDKQVFAEKINFLEEKTENLESELNRHRKYHDHIKTQVKPHLVQLKQYARGLETRSSILEAELQRRDAQISDLREQVIEVVKNSSIQVQLAERTALEVTESYEKSLEAARTDLTETKKINQELSGNELRLRRAEQRADELENELIELRRNKEELQGQFRMNQQRLAQKADELHKQNVMFKIENDDLRGKALSDHEKLQTLERQNLEQQSQLESLRFLWHARNEENERLKLSLSALEKINVDLSAKLQEIRESKKSAADSANG